MPRTFERIRDSVLCWWVFLREKLVCNHETDPRVELCLQLKKGTRFRLNGGRMQFIEGDEVREATDSWVNFDR